MNSIRTATLLLLIAPAVSWAENWPQWRGPKNDGTTVDKNVPAEWSETKNLLWKVPMPGRGGSTPCIWGDKIFLTSTTTGTSDLVAICVSTAGKELWKKVIGQGNVQARGGEGDAASPSPSTDGKHVWFLFGNGDFACLDMNGKEVWKFNAAKRYGKFDFDFGMHSTPVLFEGKLYLQLLRPAGQQVICLDAATGNEVWKIDRKSDGRAECLHSYASPFIWTNGKESYLVSHGNDYAIAHDLKDGKEIWRLGGLNSKERYNRTLRFVASPVCTPDLIVVPSAKRGVVVGVKPNAKGTFEAESEHEQWRIPKGTPDVPCPLVVDGLVYLAGESGSITCLDAKTGKQVYSQNLRNFRHRGSPVYADGKIFLNARDTTIYAVKAGPKYELLSTNKLPDEMTASIAIADGRLYLRGFKNLYAIGTK